MLRYWEGIAGAGKTTQAAQQLANWLDAGVPAEQILVLVPQRALGRPYQTVLQTSMAPNARAVTVSTLAGLAQRGLTLFWAAVAPRAFPSWQGAEPLFLNIETAQYFMAQFVQPKIESGIFDSLKMDRARVTAQILDALSKAAVHGYLYKEVYSRLSRAWVGQTSRTWVYAAAAEVTEAFRAYCLEHALLDFSLQIELFNQQLLPQEAYQQYAQGTFRYLIADNIEEYYPVALDYVSWLQQTVTEGLLIYDRDAGYRQFLGAAPRQAEQLAAVAQVAPSFEVPTAQEQALGALGQVIERFFALEERPYPDVNPLSVLTYAFRPFYPQMIDWIVEVVANLVAQGVPPGEIVIAAPYLGDSLRFSIFTRLDELGIPYLSSRPSRALRDEPVTRAVLTLLRLVYPGDGVTPPTRAEMALALQALISDLDPIRAELLVRVVYREGELNSFDTVLDGAMQQRITYRLGERYEAVRQWLLDKHALAELLPPDHALQELFEFAAHPGYGFHASLEAGRVVAELIDSAQRFREVIAPQGANDWRPIAQQYIQLVGEGVLAAVHYTDWLRTSLDAVYIAPAYTFLMQNRVVDYQVWVDVGSAGWGQRLDQPLTHPYVLARDYPDGQPWDDAQEVQAQQDTLRRLLLGLSRRCRKRLFAAFSDLGEQGFEQRGSLLRLFNLLLQQYGGSDDADPIS
ncbi:MAG: hypothetical protein HC915_12095 [Anaerolineae bacterium]|nr:hypothetical protein [Anaerolineae bacterium]